MSMLGRWILCGAVVAFIAGGLWSSLGETPRAEPVNFPAPATSRTATVASTAQSNGQNGPARKSCDTPSNESEGMCVGTGICGSGLREALLSTMTPEKRLAATLEVPRLAQALRQGAWDQLGLAPPPLPTR